MSTEKVLQAYIVKMLKAADCLVYKFSSPSNRGVPDLLVVPPHAPIFFIEVKSPEKTGRLSKLQEVQINRIRLKGTLVYVIDNREDAKFIIEGVIDGCPKRCH